MLMDVHKKVTCLDFGLSQSFAVFFCKSEFSHSLLGFKNLLVTSIIFECIFIFCIIQLYKCIRNGINSH